MKALIYDGYSLSTKDIENTLEEMQEIVGGWIEHVPMESLGSIDLWCNDEGKLIDLEPTIALTHKGKIYDWVCGTVVFLRHDGEGGTVGLTAKDIKFLKDKFYTDGLVFTSVGILQALEY